MNKKIVYFGNMTFESRKYFSAMETLVPKLNGYFQVKAFTKKDNFTLKMFDMIFNFFKYGIRADKIIIDVYSSTYIYGISIIVFLCQLFRKKYILVLHGGNLPNRYNKTPSIIHFLFNKAMFIIAPSQYLKFFFESKNYKIEYIPNILDIKHYKFKPRVKIRPKLIYVRGFSNIYNPQLAIKVVSILKSEFPNIELIMLGNDSEGNLKELTKMISNLQLEYNVKILGKKTRDEWIAIADNYDIMLSCPNIDNSPVSIIEGMALGLIIVSSNVGGLPFLINDKTDGFLADVDNEMQFVEVIKSLITNNNNINSMQSNARQKAESFDWEYIKPLWLKLLNS
jgi:glycosyltransferase involved in cell wall biosynthesis